MHSLQACGKIATHERKATMVCYLLPLAQLYGMLVVNVLSTFIGLIGNMLVIFSPHESHTTDNFQLLADEPGCS